MATPVQIDTTNNGSFAQQYADFTQGPVFVNGSLYALMSTNTDLEMFKSVDGGQSWAQQDAAGEPSDPLLNGGTCFFDLTAGLVWVVTSASGGGPAPLQIWTFDATTDTWALIDNAGPNVGEVYACILRTDATLFIASNAAGAPTSLEFDIFDTGTSSYTASGDLAADITSLPEYDPANVSAFNPTFTGDNGMTAAASTIFFGYMTTDDRPIPQMNQGVFFCGFDLANTTLNFFVVPGQIGNPQPNPPALRCSNGPYMGPPAVCGPGNVVFAVAANTAGNTNYASLFVSTDSGASWTFDDAPTGIDPAVTPGIVDRAQFSPMSFFDGTRLYCAYAALPGPPTFTFPSTAIRVCVTVPDFAANPDTWTWTASTALTIGAVPGKVAGINGFSFSKISIQNGETLLSTDISGFPFAGWFVPFGIGAPARFQGTFIGFMVAGQFGGGTK